MPAARLSASLRLQGPVPVVAALAVLIMGFALVTPAHAATSNGISVTLYNDGGTCLSSDFDIAWSFTAQYDDVSGDDGVGMIAYDGNGVPIAADWTSAGPPGSATRHTVFGATVSQINAMTARPLTIVMYDITSYPPGGSNTQAVYDNIVGQGAPVIDQLVFDVASVLPSCDTLPLLQQAAIPVLSSWGLVAFAMLLALAGAVWLRRQ